MTGNADSSSVFGKLRISNGVAIELASPEALIENGFELDDVRSCWQFCEERGLRFLRLETCTGEVAIVECGQCFDMIGFYFDLGVARSGPGTRPSKAMRKLARSIEWEINSPDRYGLRKTFALRVLDKKRRDTEVLHSMRSESCD